MKTFTLQKGPSWKTKFCALLWKVKINRLINLSTRSLFLLKKHKLKSAHIYCPISNQFSVYFHASQDSAAKIGNTESGTLIWSNLHWILFFKLSTRVLKNSFCIMMLKLIFSFLLLLPGRKKSFWWKFCFFGNFDFSYFFFNFISTSTFRRLKYWLYLD